MHRVEVEDVNAHVIEALHVVSDVTERAWLYLADATFFLHAARSELPYEGIVNDRVVRIRWVDVHRARWLRPVISPRPNFILESFGSYP